ncbi:MAG TPA: alpha/beta fold hydrolase [Candidatus Binatia bacterium]|nr:alpha/beta fold hydrolase [Candidatus Binatia bacterium]
MTVPFLREDEVDVRAPSPLLLIAETRAYAEYLRFLAVRAKLLRELPRGDGHAVLVIPGFGTRDHSTRPLREMLRALGYDARGWGQGRNLGMRGGIRDALRTLIRQLHEREGRKVSLVGWSLGGVFARELARAAPECVRRVFTLGSPFNGHPNANNVYALWKIMNRGAAAKLDWDGFQRRRTPPPVPCTAIHSKNDGIVAWRCSVEEQAPNTENVEVRGSHFGLGYNPEVIRVIADRLARPA